METKMNEQYTKEQILEQSAKILGDIRVPVGLKADISDPIYGVINNIIVVLHMLAAEQQARENEKKQEETPEADEILELVKEPDEPKEDTEDGNADAK